MNRKPLLLLPALLLLGQSCALAQEEKPKHPLNKQYQDQETWVQFADTEAEGQFRSVKRRMHPYRPGVETAPPVASPATPAPAADPDTLSVPYILAQPADNTPPPATSQLETTWVPTGQPGAAPYWSGGGNYFGLNYWGPNAFWPGAAPSWGSPYFNQGWRAPLGIYNSAPSMTFMPQTRRVQSGPSKASGNYFNPSTPDPTASGNYYAPSGNAPRAMPVYQPDPASKDYWGKQGSPLPTEMQPQ